MLIPVYNAAATIPLVLEALSKSNFKDFETVPVHDCSTDNTGQVLEELAEALPLPAVSFPENRGVSKARNTAAREARGEIILFIDADCMRAAE